MRLASRANLGVEPIGNQGLIGRTGTGVVVRRVGQKRDVADHLLEGEFRELGSDLGHGERLLGPGESAPNPTTPPRPSLK